MDGSQHRVRQPAATAARRLHDGQDRTSLGAGHVRTDRHRRLGPGPVHPAHVVSVRGPRAPGLRHGHCVHRGAHLPG